MSIANFVSRFVRRTSKIVLAFIVLLIVARLILPYAVETYVNRTLSRIPEYDGRIGDVDIALIRGAYKINDVKIVKITGKIPEPFFQADVVDLSVEWKALLEGKWVGEIVVDSGRLNFVNGPSDNNSQTEVKSQWLDVIKDLFPLRLNRFELDNSMITYNDHYSHPPVKIELSKVNLTGKNFSNTRSPANGLVANVEGTGILEKKGKVVLKAALEPSAEKPTFKVETALETFPISALNDFLKAYGNVDAEGGTISIYSELEAKSGKLRGYVKPLVKGLKLLGQQKEKESVFGLAWETVVAALAEIFENQRHDQIATKVEVEGSLDNVQTSTLQTIWGIIKNAFVKAFKPGWEKSL